MGAIKSPLDHFIQQLLQPQQFTTSRNGCNRYAQYAVQINALTGEQQIMYFPDFDTLIFPILQTSVYYWSKNQERNWRNQTKDIIEQSKAIHKLKIRGEWHRSEITKKTRELFAKIGIDYLK